MNTFGRLLKLTDFGESHGPAVGGVLSGFPAGVHIDKTRVQEALDRRRPGSSSLVSARNEPDRLQWLSGITEDDVTLGSPIAFIIPNTDTRPADYKALEGVYRPGHADYTWHKKYGVPLPPGGGYASARRTAACVAAGALAQQYLESRGIQVRAFLSGLGPLEMHNAPGLFPAAEEIYASEVRCPDAALSHAMKEYLTCVRSERDSVGGIVTFIARGVPAGLGEPPYDKLSARLTQTMMTINAAKGVMTGDTSSLQQMAARRGSGNVDQWNMAAGEPQRRSNHAGGMEGGVSNGEDIVLTVVFKPTPTIGLPLRALTAEGHVTTLSAAGRHDPCVAVRAVSVVEAMGALVLADALLISNAYR